MPLSQSGFRIRKASSPATGPGEWAVVTGASDGIGRAFAVALAERGLNLVLVARRGDRLQAIASELRSRFECECRVVELDLAGRGAVDEIELRTRELDVGLLVAAAGFGTSGPLIGNTLEIERQMVEVNCGALLGLTHLFARRFVARGRGGLILMSSLLAFQGVPRAANYAATKAYVQSLAEGLRHELTPLGVEVLACAPGPIRSGFEARAGLRMGLAQSPDVVALGALAALGRRTTVRPGWLSRLLEAALAALPRWGRTRMLKRVMAGMTAHQRTQASGPVPISRH